MDDDGHEQSIKELFQQAHDQIRGWRTSINCTQTVWTTWGKNREDQIRVKLGTQVRNEQQSDVMVEAGQQQESASSIEELQEMAEERGRHTTGTKRTAPPGLSPLERWGKEVLTPPGSLIRTRPAKRATRPQARGKAQRARGSRGGFPGATRGRGRPPSDHRILIKLERKKTTCNLSLTIPPSGLTTRVLIRCTCSSLGELCTQ